MILTMSDGVNIIKNGQVWVHNQTIIFAGAENELVNQNNPMIWDREIDCDNNLLMPGFKNAHTHSPMTCLRSLADDMPLDDWLHNQVFPIEAQMTSEDIYDLTKLAVLEYVSGGITAIFDMYINPEQVGKACVDMGMRCVQVGSVNDFTLTPEYIEKMYLKWNNDNPLISYVLGFHAEYTTSEPILKQIAQLSKKYKAPVFTHLSETKREVESCIRRNNMTPTAYLDSLGLFDNGGGGYHCNYMTDEDIDIFKRKNLTVVTNPASNLKLASGIAPITAFLKNGISVAIGTDGAASNNCLDMFREMFLVTGLAKYRENDASAVNANEVLKMATLNGSYAMGLSNADTLEAGKLADLIMIDLNQPNMQPINNITKNIVYSGNKQNVKLTMINGEILYENGIFHIGDEAKNIYRKANQIVERFAFFEKK